jgi:hypothetical protein
VRRRSRSSTASVKDGQATYQNRFRELVAQLGDVGSIAAGSITCRQTAANPSCHCLWTIT